MVHKDGMTSSQPARNIISKYIKIYQNISNSTGTSLSPKTCSWICPCREQVEARLLYQEASEKFLFKMMSLFVSSSSLSTLSPMRCWGFQDSTIYQTGEVLGFAYGRVYRFGWQKSSIGRLLGSWVAAYVKHTTSLALLRPLQEFAQWPSANGRCTSTSFVSVVGCSVLCSWNSMLFGYGSSRIELPAIKAATNRCGFGTSGSSWSLGCYSAAWQLQGFWTESVLNKDATWLPS